MFTKTLKTRIIGKVAVALGISVPFIVDYIMYVLDPAAKLAEVMYARNDDPNNGYFDVIWSKH